MKIFNLAHRRHLLDNDTGFEWFLSIPFEKAKAAGGLASGAEAHINLAVECVLVGYSEPARKLLSRAQEWLLVAIRDKERSIYPEVAGGAEAQRYHNLALCNWLLAGKEDIENSKLSIRYHEQFLSGSGLGKNKTEIDLSLVRYIDAKAYDEGLSRFEGARFEAPASLNRVNSEAQMAYLLCRNALYGEFDAVNLDRAKLAFLMRKTNKWLTNGLFSTAAEWMKVLHWSGDETEASAWAAIMRCYDYIDAQVPNG